MMAVEDKLMKLTICDDEIVDAEKASSIIKKTETYKDFEIEIRTPQDVMIAVEEDLFKCDILVMDIQFEGENYDGIQLTQMINEKFPTCRIVFLTNILDFAPFVYETNHCYFVTKENIDIMLPRAITKAVEDYNNVQNEMIELITKSHKVFLPESEIVYIERQDRVLFVHTNNDRYPCYLSLKKMEGKLGNTFVRCHGGFIVNLSYVSGIVGTEVILKDGNKIPIGMRFFDSFKMKYLKYYSDRM